MAFEDDDDQFANEDASGLRKQLGKLGRQLKERDEKLAKYEARDLITSKGFTLVKPEEIVSVPEDEREAHAKKLHEEREGMQRDLLRTALKDRVEDEEALEELVNEVLGERAAKSDTAQHVERARELGHIDSKPAPLVDTRKLHGREAIEAAFANPKK